MLPATLRSLTDMVAEYEAKRDGMGAAEAAFKGAVGAMESAACIGGAYGGQIWYRGTPSPNNLQDVLLKSAWEHVVAGLNIREIATAKDLDKLKTGMQNPPPFTLDNIRATFGKYLLDPRGHMLRGVAEAFADLDPAYRSHSNVKIGVAGLPKRVILKWALSRYGLTGSGWREGQMRNILDAMAALNAQPKMTWQEFSDLVDRARKGDDPQHLGVTLRAFDNGNVHLIFDPAALRQINLALAEFYGDVLPDAPEESPRGQAGTAVSKDLAFYPTPAAVCGEMLSKVHIRDGIRILEPSCGDGRILEAVRSHVIKNRLQDVRIAGVEVEAGRAELARAKGFSVRQGNFLEVVPEAVFDLVLMNPPFAGKHYLKHIRHAMRFLKPGGQLVAVLPNRDQDALPKGGHWEDLPIASFAESGTNVPTGLWKVAA